MMKKQKAEIIRLLKQKQESCSRLLQKVEEQMELVNLQDESRLLGVVEAKETMVDQLNEIDRKIAEEVSSLNEATRKALVREGAELARCIENDLEKIIAIETVCQEKIDQVKTEVVEKIMELKKGQVLLKGYGVSPRVKSKISKNV
jgi:hypothetical protein